jgi:hypothetical protein
MITLDLDARNATLQAPWMHPKPFVEVIHPTLGFIDLSDRVISLKINASIDNVCINGSVQFARGTGVNSLSPFVYQSQYYEGDRPLLDPSAGINIGIAINSGPNNQLVNERIDRVDAGAGPGVVSVTWRDASAKFLNKWIREPRKYGSPTGMPSQDVMKQILYDWNDPNPNSIPFILEVFGDPNFAVLEYPQEEMPILEAMRRIAQQHGWDLRYFGEQRCLVYYDPRVGTQRTYKDGQWIYYPGVAQVAFTSQRYEDITQMDWGDEDVRNQWDVCFYDKDNGGKYTIVYAEDTDSIARYGERYARVNLDRTTNIDTMQEANDFLNIVLADTAYPFVQHAVRLPCFPQVELNDFYYFETNNDEYDNPLMGVVGAYSHDYANGHWSTTIGCRVSPITAYREYRNTFDRRQIIQVMVPDESVKASEGTVCFVTDSLAFPP